MDQERSAGRFFLEPPFVVIVRLCLAQSVVAVVSLVPAGSHGSGWL